MRFSFQHALSGLWLLFSIAFVAGSPVNNIHSLQRRDTNVTAPVNRTMPFGTIKTSQDGYIVRATFDHGPINIMDWSMVQDLATFVDSLKNDSSVKVVIFDSANPEFFIAQFSLLKHPNVPAPIDQVKLFLNATEAIATLPIVFIAEIAGRARGAGNEFILQCDIRYAAKDRVFLGNFETALGMIPGGGGISYLLNLVGRAKAMEYVISGKDIGAEDAAAVNWINGAYEYSELSSVVNNFAQRVAKFPADGIAAAKARINVGKPPFQEILDDYNAWVELAKTPAAQDLVAKEMILSQNEGYTEYQLFEGDEVMEVYNM
ncbi:ClpP/crotonase [Xylona heveae TC161]|uniref:ClpP/crotonase n=1 Tax=Xylona heveae (strain CBS 132557 / TC161) TaxID=1328760 RepID=A0A165ISC7_XYLHT|nr:ClpP/crotonase [Xylona heveae TC161]KZF25315.1 ClpP/crotonase [Xylona heveae TC161]